MPAFRWHIWRIACVVIMALAPSIASADLKHAIDAINAGDCDRGFPELTELAKGGHARAQYLLAREYYFGECVAQDMDEAFRWTLSAARLGDRGAQTQVGWMYANGVGVEQDLKNGAIWSLLAARRGDARARSNLTEIAIAIGHANMRRREDVPQDFFLRAHVWFSIAAHYGNADGKDFIRMIEEMWKVDPDTRKLLAEAKRVLDTCLMTDLEDCPS